AEPLPRRATGSQPRPVAPTTRSDAGCVQDSTLALLFNEPCQYRRQRSFFSDVDKMWRILTIAIVVFLACSAQAQENVTLKPGFGRDVVNLHSITCHSLDYITMNSPFLDRKGWETEVNKMIKMFGAQIEPTDAKMVIDYLVTKYGSGN